MTGVNDKLDKLLEDMAATREHMSAIEMRLDKLESDLKPIFFQATAIKFSGLALAAGLSVATALGALFPNLSSSILTLIVSALLKGVPR